jgi:uncharacterized OB-fold protein
MTTLYQPRDIESPQATPETAPYWDAAAQDRLVIKRCEACNAAHHYPRALCPFCGSDRTVWIDASGHGVIYSVSVTRRGTPTPYAMAYVTLAEGVTLMTNIVDCDFDALRIGDPVVVTFVTSRDGKKVPMFRPQAVAETSPSTLQGA